MKVENCLAVLLAKKRMKISELSSLSGISRTTLTKLYNNKELGITYAVLNKLCLALDCSINDFWDTTK